MRIFVTRDDDFAYDPPYYAIESMTPVDEKYDEEAFLRDETAILEECAVVGTGQVLFDDEPPTNSESFIIIGYLMWRKFWNPEYGEEYESEFVREGFEELPSTLG
jgi:hypothetical protein